MRIAKTLLLLSLLAACKEEPKVLDKHTYAKVYTELTMVQNQFTFDSRKYPDEQSFLKSLDSARQIVFDFYKTDTTAYHRASKYYAQHPDELRLVIAEITKELDTLSKQAHGLSKNPLSEQGHEIGQRSQVDKNKNGESPALSLPSDDS